MEIEPLPPKKNDDEQSIDAEVSIATDPGSEDDDSLDDIYLHEQP